MKRAEEAAPPFLVRPAEASDALGLVFRHALTTDPDGCFVAEDAEGRVVGRAAGAARDDVLRILELEVDASARGAGVGSALLDALRAYGAARPTAALEVEAPLEPSSLAFAAKKRLTLRTLLLSLELTLREAPPLAASAPALDAFAAGAGLSGWVAALDRETFGYARTPDWTAWLRGRGVRAFALRSGGRPEGISGLFVDGERTHIGPLAARTPTAAAGALAPLLARAFSLGGRRVTLRASADARLVLDVALGLGFRVAGARALLSTRPRGDLRRALGGPTFF